MLDGLRAYGRLGMKIPPVHIVINNIDLTGDAQMIEQSVREIFHGNSEISVLDCTIPAAVVFRNAASLGIPAHRLEYRQPSNRKSPAALNIVRQLAIELFPQWRERFEGLTESTVESLVKGAR
jgi:chromosome partitioning related protein ParA